MQHDAIIVGAGPAGSAAAIRLAQNGRKVLIIDWQQFPRDKVCGDGIGPGTIRALNRLSLAEKIKAENFNSINKIRLVSPGDISLTYQINIKNPEEFFFIAPRVRLDNLLLQEALDSGADFMKARVHNVIIENEMVVGVRIRQGKQWRDIYANVVVGADGASSAVARSLSIKSAQSHKNLVWIRGVIEGLAFKQNRLELFFLPEIFPVCGWIFPIDKNRANIGLGQYRSAYKQSRPNLNDLLKRMLDHSFIRNRLDNTFRIENVKTWVFNIASWKRPKIAFDGALLAGDAADLADPLTCEGIQHALVSGILAGDVINDALDAGNYSYSFLRKYEMRCGKEIFNGIHRSIILKNICLGSLDWCDWFFNWTLKNKKLAGRTLSSIVPAVNFRIVES